MKFLLHFCTVLLYFVTQTTSEEKDLCPPLQDGCECTHKRKGLRIECKNVEYVSFPSLSSNVSVEMDLSSNRLTFLNASTFPHPNQIKKLLLKNNFLRRIDGGTFEGFNALKRLDISKNFLVEIKASTFKGLGESNITELILSNNRILQISKVAFAGLNIEFLDLSNQKNWKKESADILSYSDFLSFSIVKHVNLGQNKLLCDCNMKWLVRWSSNKLITDNTKCYYPLQMRGVKIGSLSEDWQCNLHTSSFALPEFHLVPYNDQVMFQNDGIEYYCYSTWMELTTIKWFKNGIPLKSSPGMKIVSSVNLTLASFSSKLTINRLTKDFHGDITCEVDVGISGSVSKTRKIYLISDDLQTCDSNTTKTERGVISWPTSYSGTIISSKCPFGSLDDHQYAYRGCNGSRWKDVDVTSCYFDDPSTQLLQKYYKEIQTHSFTRIISMAQEFTKNFVLNHHLIKTKYDLYFLYQILHEITIAYKGYDGKTYSAFFWNATGMIAESHQNLDSIKEPVYGHTSGWRFRYLLEEFVSEQIKLDMYKTIFLLNTHHSMTSASYSFSTSMTGELHCYLTTHNNFQVHCYPKRNYEANKASTVVVFLNVGSNVRVFRFTVLAFKTSTFFRSTYNESVGESTALSSVVGFKLTSKMNDGSERNMIPGLRLTFSKNAFKLSNPRLVYWFTPNGEDIYGSWKKPTTCLPSEYFQKNASVYECQYFNTQTMTYIAVLGTKPSPIYLDPNYLHPIVYIGAALACIFLIFTLVVYVYFCYVRQVLYNRTDSAALMNFCIALLVGEVIFAIGIHRVDDRLLCTGVAVGLHFFLMSAFVWLGCGGVALLRLVKKKDRADVSVYDPVTKYYLVGWGFPLIISSITVAYDHQYYGTDKYCWLRPKTSLGAFIGVGSVVLLADLIVFCFLHAAINRLFPEPIEGGLSDDESADDGNEDENCNRDQCDAKQCRYNKQANKKECKVQIPKRRELLQQLHAGLLILLFMVLTITFVSMIYGSQGTSSRFLYSFFTYGSACCNVFIGILVFYFHCVRRRDLQKLIVQTILQRQHKHQQEDASETAALVSDQNYDTGGRPLSINDQTAENESAYIEAMNTGVFGLSDHVVSDGSQFIPSIAPEVVKIPEKVNESETEHEATLPTYDEVVNDQIDDLERVTPECKAPISQSELSEVERVSNTHNSIGECSLASSSRKKAPPKPVEIPQNLKNFVPENWRPARRRMNKGASYYPYYVSETNPISASLAYSSKSSSLASTTVSGVPLYKHSNGLRPHTGMTAPMMHHPRFPSNVPIRFAPPPPQYTPQHAATMNTKLPLVAMQQQQHHPLIENYNKTSNTPPPPKMEENNVLLEESEEVEEKEEDEEEKSEEVDEEEEEEEEKTNFVVSPTLYIPMPHVSIKQFILRNETSV